MNHEELLWPVETKTFRNVADEKTWHPDLTDSESKRAYISSWDKTSEIFETLNSLSDATIANQVKFVLLRKYLEKDSYNQCSFVRVSELVFKRIKNTDDEDKMYLEPIIRRGGIDIDPIDNLPPTAISQALSFVNYAIYGDGIHSRAHFIKMQAGKSPEQMQQEDILATLWLGAIDVYASRLQRLCLLYP